MTSDEKIVILDRLYGKLRSAKTDKDKINLRKQIREVKEILTTEDYEKMMVERSELDTSKFY